MADPVMPKTSTLDDRERHDKMRFQLSRIEDQVLEAFDNMGSNADARWLAIGRTQIQLGFMAAKRALYEGKRVGD